MKLKLKSKKLLSAVIIAGISAISFAYYHSLDEYGKAEIKAILGSDNAKWETITELRNNLKNDQYFDLYYTDKKNYYIRRYSTPLKILSNEPFFLGNINACIEHDDVCNKLTRLVSAYIERNKYSYDKIKSEHYSQNILKLLSIGNLYTNEGKITIEKYIQDKKQEYLSPSNEWKHINLLELAENIYFYASFYEEFTTIQEILDIIITDQDSEVKVRDDAILLLGLSSLYRCYKCNDDIEEKGIKLLDILSNKGNKLSQMVLANYYYSKSNYKLAEKYSIKYINDRPFLDTRLAYISEHFESPEYILYEVKHCDFFCYDNYEKTNKNMEVKIKSCLLYILNMENI